MLALLVASAALAGCSSQSGARSADAVARARIDVDQRLAGRWKLRSFVPDTQLDPVLQSMLVFHQESLSIVFQQGRLQAQSPGLTFDRAYRIDDPLDEWFKLTITDDQGVGYQNLGQFDDAGRITFRSLTPPWKGTGVLEREGAALDAH